MIVEPRLVEYLNSLETELPEHLKQLEEYAIAHEVPIIRKEAQSLSQRSPSWVQTAGSSRNTHPQRPSLVWAGLAV